jgi:hypothetical protein
MKKLILLLKDEHTLVANCFGSYYGTIYYTKIRQY